MKIERSIIAYSISAFLMLGIILLFLNIDVNASENETEDGFKYEIAEDGVKILGYTGENTEIVIPELIDGKKVTVIGNGAFSGNKQLTKVVIPYGVKSIGSSSFYGCEKITEVFIPNSIKSLGKYTFCFCKSLERVSIPSGVNTIDEGIFGNCISLEEVRIPDTVTSIGSRAFEGCKSLERVLIPDSVIDINSNSFGSGSMYLTIVGTPDSYAETFAKEKDYKFSYVSALQTSDGFRYEINENNDITIIDYIGTDTVVIIPSNIEGKKVTVIGEQAFMNCKDFTEVTIPEDISSLGFESFKNCTNLLKVNLPNTLVSMGDGVFGNCISLTDVILPQSLEILGKGTFGGCSSLSKIEIPESVKTIDNGAFSRCTSLTEMMIPDSVETVGTELFSGCTNLANVRLSRNTFEIGQNFFSKCSNLERLTIPDGVTRIGGYAFYECSKLDNIILPDSVSFIGYGAFCGCTSLSRITIPEGVTQINSLTFDFCRGLVTASLPNSLECIGYGAFANCSSLFMIRIPDKVTSIDSRAFESCSNMREIVIPSSVTSIQEPQFYKGHSDFTIVGEEGSYAEEYAKSKGIAFSTESAYPGYDGENPFDDVSIDSNYYSAVMWAYNSKPQVVAGVSDTMFKPYTKCNRAQIVTFLWRMKGEPEVEKSDDIFKDVNDWDFYNIPVLWAAHNEIASGKSEGWFSPLDTCTRAQFVSFIWRLEGKPAPQNSSNPFVDVPDNSSYKDAVIWAYENGITMGIDSTHFSPKGVINRAQAVMFLHRYSTKPKVNTGFDYTVFNCLRQ